ncbi:hypothetical protein Rhsp01_46940 [Rhizobium sp. NBRC 114257]|uniref:Lysozyme inhibitor LprI N-terminal domain-containing protein n=2 Tax=Rhizobium/Agrobacterium group TaxID=227290 RepID=A0ABQ0Z8H8_9HYPH|nr:hypothetical protein RsS93_44590 [Rhizobium dioscoreae]GLU83518.1 hypothetical protein Rhsp01_46940 [Rhizobium sp. NBRC 114257]
MKHKWSFAAIKNRLDEQKHAVMHFELGIVKREPDMRLIHLAAATFLVSLGMAGTSRAASFDCEAQNLKPDEKTICDVRALNDADVKMVTTFDLLSGLLAMGARGTMQDQQTEWLKKRQACEADVACLKASYEERLKVLNDTYKQINRPL